MDEIRRGVCMTYHPKTVFAAACAAIFIFGIVMTILGAVLPSIIETFGIDKSAAGSLFFIMTIGMLIGSLAFGPIVDRYGYKALLIICSAMVLAGLELIGLAKSFAWLRLAMVLIGLGGGVINGGSNAVVADISEGQRGGRLSLLGVFFGIGAFSIPMVLGILLRYFDYTTLTAAVGWLVLLPILFFLFVRFPQPKHKQGFPLAAASKLIKESALLLFGLMLFFQSGMEMTMGGWSSTFFKEALYIDASRAVFYLSFYWLAMMTARLLLPVVLKSMDPTKVLRIFYLLAIIGAVMMIVAKTITVALPGLFLLGFGFAAAFPIILGFVGDRYPNLSGTAFSIAFVMALIGGSLMPYLSGWLGDAFGLRTAFTLVPLSLLVVWVLSFASMKKNP